MFNLVVWSAFNEKTRFRILNPIFWFNCSQLASCKLQDWCKILLFSLVMLFNVFLLLCITKVYLAKRSSILNVQKSKVHVIYWKAYMHILHTIQKEFKSSLDWLTQWKLKVSGFWKTSKLVGFQCYSQLREFYLNIRPWFWRCIRMLTLLIKLPIIWNRFVTWK
jgi:hypothetical protein